MTPPVAAPPRRRPVQIDPRIRERRADVLRQRARRRLRAVLAVVALLVAGSAGWVVVHSPLLAARVVTVVGSAHTPAAQVVAAAGLSGHPPLIDVGAAATAGVERLPWVASAAVQRQWPDGVRIVVVERTPVAAVAVGATGEWALVDRTGRVLADVAHVPTGVVAVAGVGQVGPPGTTVAGARAALAVARVLPRAFAGQVTEVSRGPTGDVTLHLTSPVTVDLGSTVDLAAKFEDVAAILAGAPLRAGDVIDVTAPDQPVVRP